MRSLSKTSVSAAQAQTIVRHVFGTGTAMCTFNELTDGYFNAAYQLDLADGRRCVLKVAPPDAIRVLRYEKDIMHAEADALLQNVLVDGREMDVSLPLAYEKLYARLAAAFPALDEISSPRLVHWDLWDGNIFLDPQTRAITGIVDFERVLWGDPLMEANFVFWRDSSAFMDGYARPMLDTPAKNTRRLLYNIYLWLIMIIACYYRKYENDTQEKWARAELGRQGVLKVKAGLRKFRKFTTESTHLPRTQVPGESTENLCFSPCSQWALWLFSPGCAKRLRL
jgi:hypothetical protein